MNDTYEKDIAKRTSDRNLILLGCRADADIAHRDRKISELQKILDSYQATRDLQSKLVDRLKIEQAQFKEIRLYTQDGVLAQICANHESNIHKLLQSLPPTPDNQENE